MQRPQFPATARRCALAIPKNNNVHPPINTGSRNHGTTRSACSISRVGKSPNTPHLALHRDFLSSATCRQQTHPAPFQQPVNPRGKFS